MPNEWNANEVLAQALCDSSSHLNLLPHDEQRPCAYHLQRATDTLKILNRRSAKGDSYHLMHFLPPRQRAPLVIED